MSMSAKEISKRHGAPCASQFAPLGCLDLPVLKQKRTQWYTPVGMDDKTRHSCTTPPRTDTKAAETTTAIATAATCSTFHDGGQKIVGANDIRPRRGRRRRVLPLSENRHTNLHHWQRKQTTQRALDVKGKKLKQWWGDIETIATQQCGANEESVVVFRSSLCHQR